MVIRVGDAVRLRPESPLREVLEPWADAVGRVHIVFDQLDDDDGLRIAVAYPGSHSAYTSPLSAEDFVRVDHLGEGF